MLTAVDQRIYMGVGVGVEVEKQVSTSASASPSVSVSVSASVSASALCLWCAYLERVLCTLVIAVIVERSLARCRCRRYRRCRRSCRGAISNICSAATLRHSGDEEKHHTTVDAAAAPPLGSGGLQLRRRKVCQRQLCAHAVVRRAPLLRFLGRHCPECSV